MEMMVGEVARRSGIKVSTLHFYEQKELIYSWRNQGNQRRYHRSVLRRIAVIKAAQMVGNWNSMLEHRIQQLKALQSDLGGCIGCGCLSMESCAIYNHQDIRAESFSDKTRLTNPEDWSSEV